MPVFTLYLSKEGVILHQEGLSKFGYEEIEQEFLENAIPSLPVLQWIEEEKELISNYSAEVVGKDGERFPVIATLWRGEGVITTYILMLHLASSREMRICFHGENGTIVFSEGSTILGYTNEELERHTISHFVDFGEDTAKCRTKDGRELHAQVVATEIVPTFQSEAVSPLLVYVKFTFEFEKN